MTALHACPLCRADLDRQAVELRVDGPYCPACGGSLGHYVKFKSAAAALAQQARELLSRGDREGARALLTRISQIVHEDELALAPLAARLAALDGDFAQAEQLLGQLSGEELLGAALLLKNLRASRAQAQELYNYALSACRTGRYQAASDQLEHAAGLDPTDAALWRLKLKADLKAGRYGRCYRDLQALDRLGARPPEFMHLEQLLPPLAAEPGA